LTLAGVLVMLLAATVPRLLEGDRSSWRLWWRWIPSAAALTLTYVRGAWIGLMLGAGLALLTARRIVAVVSVLGVVLVCLLALPGALQRARTIGDRADPTTADRVAMIRAGVHMVRDYPLLGTGAGQVGRLYPTYATPDAIRRSTGHLHNTPLQILVERGALGFLLWLAIWVTFFLRACRALPRIPGAASEDRLLLLGCILAVASFLVAGLFEYNFGDSEVLLVACTLMGIAFVIEREWPPDRTTSATRPAPRLSASTGP
jgi:O-antigen ligase